MLDMSRILLVILTLTIVIGGLYLGITTLLNNQNNDSKPVTITIWGIKEDEAMMKNVIEAFRKRHPNVAVNYSIQSLQNYRTRVQTQIANGQAADIVAVHNSWTPMFYQAGSLAPAPDEIFNSGSFSNTFYPVVSQSFINRGKVYGVPTEIDGLALFVNQDILKAQNITQPKTWDDVVNAAVLTAVVDQKDTIQTGGLGMGSTNNVDFWPGIIGLLYFQQPGAQITRPANPAGNEVIQFFKNPTGSQPKKVWAGSMPNTTKAFTEGKLAFYLGSAFAARGIRSANPSLNFTVMSVPQLPDKTAAFACFWGYGVSSSSKNQKVAWQFLRFLSDAETQRYIFEEETKKYGLGRPYPRKDLKGDLENDQYLGAFVKQGEWYKTFYLCTDTQDNGLNDQMIEAFKIGVDSGNLTELQGKIPAILNQFAAPAPQ